QIARKMTAKEPCMAGPDREKQLAEAEEILGDRLKQLGFVKGLFFGQYLGERLLPYPDAAKDLATTELAQRLREFCIREVDPVAIDRNSEIPQSVITRLGRLGILGACLPRDCGCLALSQTAYCRL